MITRQELSDLLHNHMMKICFMKKDETQREMLCTLQKDLLPLIEEIAEEVTNKPINEPLIPVWDVINNGWRSIIIDRIYHYEIVE
jgi:hypothetical protein